MKHSFSLIFVLFFSVNSFCQSLLFEDFESWTSQGVQGEVPDGWKTNNSNFQANFFYPVTKSSDSYKGKYALNVKTAQGFEGPTPGNAGKTIHVPGNYNNFNAMVFNIKCPDITKYGKVRIAVVERKLDMLSVAALWEDSVIVGQYTPITLLLKKMNAADSITVIITALNKTDALHSVGYAEMLVDNIEFTYILGVESEVSTSPGFSLYPNPSQDVIHLKSDVDFQSYSIHLLTGESIENGILDSNSKSITVKNLDPGAYLVRLYHNGQNSSYRFIKL